MELEGQTHLLRFEDFELNLRTRELRQQTKLVKLQDLPVRLLILLATRAGELVTREEIEQELWGDDHFVDFDHGINTAMRKVREALGENPESPRFIETLPRKGYRFIATVERGASEAMRSNGNGAAQPPNHEVPVMPDSPAQAAPIPPPPPEEIQQIVNTSTRSSQVTEPIEFALPTGPARNLFLLTQAGYLAMYCAALYKLDDVGRVLDRSFDIPPASSIPTVIAVAICGIAVRLFLFTSVGLRHPNAGVKYLRLFPMVLVLDILWVASPLLLVEKIGLGLSMASIAGLAYLPFSQRILMSNLYPRS